MDKKMKVLQNESKPAKMKDMDKERLTFTLTDKQQGTLKDEKAGAILYTAMAEPGTYESGLVGQFSPAVLEHMAISTVVAVVNNMKEHLGMESQDYLQFMAEMTSEVMDRVYTPQEKIEGIIHGLGSIMTKTNRI
jgi:hypothetical protein